MTPGSQGSQLSPEKNRLGLERIVFFSDAVMAIAITLLVIDLKLPAIPAAQAVEQLPVLLKELAPHIVSFLISFAVVGVYWSTHHMLFTHIKRYNRQLIALNLFFLLFIALMPFFTSLQGQYSQVPMAVIAYALEVAATGLSIALIWWYASYQHRLVEDDLDTGFIRTRNHTAVIIPSIFLISAPFALLNPQLTVMIWCLSPLIWLLVSRFIVHRIST
jgi:TMEM175 potassium channel family protein